MNAIHCEHLTRTFGKSTALNDVSFSVPEGSFFALLGPNGAGKSTTLKIFLNLVAPSSGKASVLGKSSEAIKASAFTRIGYIAEGQDLPEWMTGTQLLDYCRPFYPTWDSSLQGRLQKQFNVPMERPIRVLSRGQRMQISLLSTIPFRPELLILDEPFSGLDPLVRDDLIQAFLELPNSDRPGTIVISSHDIDEVERLADELTFLANGRVLIRESTESLRARFRNVEIVGPIPEALTADPDWYDFRRPSANVIQFTTGTFDPAKTALGIEARIPGSQATFRPMVLREIFVALARRERSVRESHP